METFETFCKRRSIRSYTGNPVSEEQLKEILLAAQAAPVSRGEYDSMHISVIEDKELMEAMNENTKKVFHDPEICAFYNAPTFILVSGRMAPPPMNNSIYSSAAMIVQNMSYAAIDLGVGCCYIWSAVLAMSGNEELIKRLHLPEGFVPCGGLVIGETDEEYTHRVIPKDRIAVDFLR